MVSKGNGQTPAEIFFVSQINNGVISVYENGTCFNHKTKRYIGTNTNSYRKLSMFDEVTRKIYHIQLHRLIWIVFKGDIMHPHILNHKDGNKLNASLSNLEISTASDNANHAINTGLKLVLKGEKNPISKIKDKDVIFYRKLFSENKITVKDIATQLNVHHVTVRYFLDRKSYRHI